MGFFDLGNLYKAMFDKSSLPDYDSLDPSTINLMLKMNFSDYDPRRDGDEERRLLYDILVNDFSSESIGRYGEHLTRKRIREGVDGYKRIISNVMIPNSSNTKTEIDVITVHEKGILVVENKNLGGWIFGNESQDYWMQTFPGGEKHRFYNPIKQNSNHCQALIRLLGVGESDLVSCIVFSERCTLKEVPEKTEYQLVTKSPDLVRKLKKIMDDREPIYDELRVNQIADILERYIATDEEKKKHTERVKNYSAGEVCPWCGRQLVERKGKYGEFLGCSGYPGCRYTRNVE